MWFFPVLGFTLEERLCGKKCCKHFGPEGVQNKTKGEKAVKTSVYILFM